MIVFWIFAALMLAAALWLLIPALLGRKTIRDLDRNQQNVAIARERLKELESEYGRGGLSETGHATVHGLAHPREGGGCGTRQGRWRPAEGPATSIRERNGTA